MVKNYKSIISVNIIIQVIPFDSCWYSIMNYVMISWIQCIADGVGHYWSKKATWSSAASERLKEPGKIELMSIGTIRSPMKSPWNKIYDSGWESEPLPCLHNTMNRLQQERREDLTWEKKLKGFEYKKQGTYKISLLNTCKTQTCSTKEDKYF